MVLQGTSVVPIKLQQYMVEFPSVFSDAKTMTKFREWHWSDTKHESHFFGA
jgi:hypothetical protein